MATAKKHKTMLDYVNSGDYPKVKPRSLHRAINAAKNKDGELYRIAIPSTRGLTDKGGKLEPSDTDIAFYDFVIVPDREKDFVTWLDKYHETQTGTVKRLADADALELAMSDPDAYEQYLASLEKGAARNKKSPLDSWRDYEAQRDTLLGSDDADEIQRVRDALAERVKGKSGFKGANRAAAEKMLGELDDRLKELENEQE